MKKEKRLRRRIEHIEQEDDIDDNNSSPMACIDCGKKYPLITGSSNIRCKNCNTEYKKQDSYLHPIR